MARNSIAKKDTVGTVTTFTFSNGNVLTIDNSQYNDEIRAWLTGHGVEQKVGDSYAGATNAEEAFASASKVHENLLAGNVGRARGEGSGAEASLLARAYVRVMQTLKGKPDFTIEDAKVRLTAISDEKKAAFRKDLDIRKAMNDIRAEDLAKETATAPADVTAELFA